MITVVVVAESRLVRQLLSDALDGRGSLSVLATAPDHRRGLALVEDLKPDITIVSMHMPEAHTLIGTLVAKHRRVVTLGPCHHDAVATVEDGTINDVVAAAHGAMHGAFSSAPAPSGDLDLLTATESRVLRHINEGLSNKEIAREMGVAVATVKHHVHSLLTKLGVGRRGEAAAVYRGTRPPPRQPRGTPPTWTNRSRSSRTSLDR